MADLVITAANVISGSGAQFEERPGFEMVAQGEVIRLDVSGVDVTHRLADAADDESAAQARGIAVNAGGAGQPIKIQVGGEINFGAILTVGQIYVLSSAWSGGIAPAADLGATEYPTILGVAITTSILKLGILASGVQKP